MCQQFLFAPFSNTRQISMEYEISCLNINPVDHGKNSSDFCAVGLWTDNTVRILSVPDLKELVKIGEVPLNTSNLKTLKNQLSQDQFYSPL